MAFIFRNDITWEITQTEVASPAGPLKPIQIIGQFVALDVTETVAGNWQTIGGFGRQNPILQWVGGEQESMTFVARIWSARSVLDAGRLASPGRSLTAIGQVFKDAGKELASNFGIKVEPDESVTFRQLNELKALTRAIPELGRPPICSFTYGAEIGYDDCILKSIDEIKYDEVRSDGTLRGVTCKITLMKYTPFNVELADATKLETSTLYKPVKQGDTYEILAKRYYNSPLKAVNMRRFNRELGPEVKLGDTVTILPPQHSKVTKAIKPESIALADNDQIAALRRKKLANRNKPTVSLLRIR